MKWSWPDIGRWSDKMNLFPIVGIVVLVRFVGT
jgi:hypothetical protein